MRTYEELEERMHKLKIATTEEKFMETGKGIPNPPYAVYYADETQRGADKRNMIREIEVTIALYTAYKEDKKVTQEIENTVLYDIEFEKTGRYIKNQELYERMFTCTIVQKKGVKK